MIYDHSSVLIMQINKLSKFNRNRENYKGTRENCGKDTPMTIIQRLQDLLETRYASMIVALIHSFITR